MIASDVFLVAAFVAAYISFWRDTTFANLALLLLLGSFAAKLFS